MQGHGRFRRLAFNGGVVTHNDNRWIFTLPPGDAGYADAQIDDYGPQIRRRRQYPWFPGVRLSLRASFSHPSGILRGTAGFGFWNAPFGDPRVAWPALPQAVWFFYASPPGDLPLPRVGPGQGWFVATLDAGRLKAITLAPLAPLFLLLHQVPVLRRRTWPWLRRRLGISYAPLPLEMAVPHEYALEWRRTGCRFWVDGRLLWQTAQAPRGPLGFVCWLDNQYLVLGRNGRFRWGTLPILETQTMTISDLHLQRI